MNWRYALKWMGILLAIVCGLHLLLTGSPFPLSRIDELKDPVTVSKIGADGLLLSDGRKLAIKHIQEIPVELPALQDAVRDGVEVGRDGYLVGRLKIHHWCGNDPVRYHLARINLSALLVLSGAPTTEALPEGLIRDDTSLPYGKHGLRMEGFIGLGIIERVLQEAGQSHGADSIDSAR